MGLFTFIKSLFSSKDYVKDGAQVYEAPITKEIELFTETVKKAAEETKVVKSKREPRKTSARPKKPRATKKKSD